MVIPNKSIFKKRGGKISPQRRVTMLNITFEYKDRFSRGRWCRQTCTMSSVAECIKFYGLGVDCEYRIISVEEV